MPSSTLQVLSPAAPPITTNFLALRARREPLHTFPHQLIERFYDLNFCELIIILLFNGASRFVGILKELYYRAHISGSA